MRSEKDKWSEQRSHAAARGIPFLLTFGQWFGIWAASGHMHERGRRHDQYVMARFDDSGAYERGNVRIVLAGENVREAMCLRREKGCAVRIARRLSRGLTIEEAERVEVRLQARRARWYAGYTKRRKKTH